MGFPLVDNSSNATQKTLTATDTGRVISGNKNLYTEAGAISVGESGSFTSPGSLNLTGAKLIGSTISNTVGLTSDAVAGILNSVLGAFAAQEENINDLATTSATGGKNIDEKNIVYVVLGVLALVGAIFYFQRK